MIYDTANQLAKELRESDEYKILKQLREDVESDEITKNLLDQYHKLQIKAQASMVSGSGNQELMNELQKLGEVLQMNAKASAYLIAEYRINKILSDVYKILAKAINIDLSALEG